jgi:hypothetical protein
VPSAISVTVAAADSSYFLGRTGSADQTIDLHIGQDSEVRFVLHLPEQRELGIRFEAVRVRKAVEMLRLVGALQLLRGQADRQRAHVASARPNAEAWRR